MDLMTPLKRRRKPSSLAEKARDLAVVQVVWAFVRDRIGGNLPPTRKRGGGKKRLLLIGGAATGAVAAAGGLLKRRANSENGQSDTPETTSTNGPPERTPTPAGTPHN
jgi:hypothetical protein